MKARKDRAYPPTKIASDVSAFETVLAIEVEQRGALVEFAGRWVG